jgi:transcriptional regulator with PAS, ATPase and Fis domain
MSTMIILTDAQVVELNNRIGQIQRLIENAQIIKAGGAPQPTAVTEAKPKAAKSLITNRRRGRRASLNEAKVIEIKQRLAAGKESAARIAQSFGVHVSTVNNIKYGKNWAHIKLPANS